MRVGIFSDVHGNLEALEAVLAVLRSEKAEAFWCVGDMVGYGPNPNECIDRIWSLCQSPDEDSFFPIVMGNHDFAAIEGDISQFNDRAKQAALWTRKQLTPENRERLRSFPLECRPLPGTLLVHASPFRPQEWYYAVRVPEMAIAFASCEERICFIGHSHYPQVARLTHGEIRIEKESIVPFHEESRYLVNVGSVGQPRDRDPRACAVVFDSSERTVQYFRCEYDIEAVQDKIHKAGLPGFLADRLEMGV